MGACGGTGLWERVKRRQGAIREDIVTARDTAPDQGAPAR